MHSEPLKYSINVRGLKLEVDLLQEMIDDYQPSLVCIVEAQVGKKKYITTCDSDLVKDVIKIRLHMWELKINYLREEEDMKCPICNQTEDTTEHVLEYQTAETVYKIRDNNPN